MSWELQNMAKRAPVGWSFALEPTYSVAAPTEQRVFSTLFSPPSCSPSNSCSLEINFNQSFAEINKEWYLEFTVQTTDSTNSFTVYNAMALLSQIILNVNGGPDFTISDTSKFMLYLDQWIKQANTGEFYDKLQVLRGDNDLVNGVFNGQTVSSTTPQTFVIPLFCIYQFLQDVIPSPSTVYNIKFNLTFQPIATAAGDACLFSKSSTTAQAYAQSTVSFQNIQLVRRIGRIHDSKLVVNCGSQLLLDYERFDLKKYSNISWTNVGTDVLNFKLSDISKKLNVQSVIAMLYPRGLNVAFNSSTACQFYSGWKYIGWKTSQISSDYVLDYSAPTNMHMLRDVEMKGQQMENESVYPNELINYSTSLSNYYMPFLTEIRFNYEECDGNHNVLLSNLDSTSTTTGVDFDITLSCATSLAASCDMYVFVKYYDTMQLDPKNLNRNVLVNLQSNLSQYKI